MNKRYNGENLLYQEIGGNPFRKLNMVFALVSIIPILALFYIVTARLYTLEVLTGDIGLVVLSAVLIALCGAVMGYGLIRLTLKRMIFYAQEYKKSSELKSNFIATVSHEFKGPLMVLSGEMELFEAGSRGGVSGEQGEVLTRCQRIIKRMTDMVIDLLDLYKIESGMLKLDKKTCNLVELSNDRIKELRVKMDRKNITLKTMFSSDDILTLGDEDRLNMVLNNLLDNATKYSPEGSEIRLKLLRADGCIRLEVEDAGEPIPEDKIGRVFDKFERLGKGKEGTGLGLAITKDIVELHQGRIWIEPLEDKGNRFIVVLPESKA